MKVETRGWVAAEPSKISIKQECTDHEERINNNFQLVKTESTDNSMPTVKAEPGGWVAEEPLKISIKQELTDHQEGIYNNCQSVKTESMDNENQVCTSALNIKQEFIEADIKQEHNESEYIRMGMSVSNPVAIKIEPENDIEQPNTSLIEETTTQRAYAPRTGGHWCVTCGEAFKWKKSLEQHAKQHQVEDPQTGTEAASVVVAGKQETPDRDTEATQRATSHSSSTVKIELADDLSVCEPARGERQTERDGLVSVVEVEIQSGHTDVQPAGTDTTNAAPVENDPILPIADLYKSKPGGYHCNRCKAVFRWESLLTSHMKTHANEDPDKIYECSVCPYWTRTKKYFAIHEKRHIAKIERKQSGKIDKPFECSVCGFKTAVKRYLTDHEQRHTIENRYACDVCGYSFPIQSRLRYHMRIHTGEKPLACDYCGYKTREKSSILRHIRTHTGEKPYQCSTCDFKTATKKTLIRHAKRHAGERVTRPRSKNKKPIRRSTTGLNAKLNRVLITHEQRHTDDEPFGCSLCGYRFKNRNRLRDHMRTHDGDTFDLLLQS